MKNNLPQKNIKENEILEETLDFIEEKSTTIESQIEKSFATIFSMIENFQSQNSENQKETHLESSSKLKKNTNQNISNKNINLIQAQKSKENSKKEPYKISKETCDLSTKNIIENLPKRDAAKRFMNDLPNMLRSKRKNNKKEPYKISKETCDLSTKNIIENLPKRDAAKRFMNDLPNMLENKRKNNLASNQKAKKIKR